VNLFLPTISVKAVHNRLKLATFFINMGGGFDISSSVVLCLMDLRDRVYGSTGFKVMKVGGVVEGLPGAGILLGRVISGGESFGLSFVRVLSYGCEVSSSAKEVSVVKELSLPLIVTTESFKNRKLICLI
jgi:hypothetical protein